MPSRKSSAADRRGKQLGLSFDVPGLVAGVDEAGRGPLAGPVVAAAVILDARAPIKGLADSKLLTPRRREELREEILACALCCSVAQASVEEIDAINILQATLLAMRRAIEGLRLRPVKALIDGNRVPVLRVRAEPVIGGDALVPSISAASILAKTHRDALCRELHLQHPHYGFDEHKGYGTPDHLAALRRHGACIAHRRSFAPVRCVIDGVAVVDPCPGAEATAAAAAPGGACAPEGGSTGWPGASGSMACTSASSPAPADKATTVTAHGAPLPW